MMKNSDEGGSSSVNRSADRKTIEKNRRIHMKGLYMNLLSLIPSSHFNPPKQYLSLPDQLEQSAEYIKLLRQRVEELKMRKTQALTAVDPRTYASTEGLVADGSELPILKITELGSNLEIVLISGLRKKFKLHQVIFVLEEEGANVITVSQANVGYQIVHTFHAQVKHVRIGIDTLKLSRRIEELIS